MMLNSAFKFGNVVREASEQEAIRSFKERKKYGLGGVIFTPSLTLPHWIEPERDILASEYCFANDVEQIHSCSKEWLSVTKGITPHLLKLSYAFNSSNKVRIVNFFNNDGLLEGPHRDPSATNGWLHQHIEGENGMACVNPLIKRITSIPSLKGDYEMIAYKDIQMLCEQGEAEMLTLQEGEAAMFDHTMIHMSGHGNRFRVLVIG